MAALALAAFAFAKGAGRVREGEVAVFVNNLTGSIVVSERVGYHVFVPWMTSLYRLDRRVQSLHMAERPAGGSVGGNAIKLKTSDGSNVSLDTQVTYRLIPERAGAVLRHAGPGYAFGELWVRSAVRAMAAREFGKLTTEQIYDAPLRNERAKAMIEELNRELAEHGIEIVAVVPEELRFYKEYEEVIKNKKLADQEVEEQQAKARLATEEQKKKVAEAEFSAEAKKATARGDADRIKAEADGYAERIRLEAEGALATAENRAQGQEATGLAEAEGLRQAASAVAGHGGVNLVALEYAKQLAKISFTGVPVMQDGRMGQYRIHSVPQTSSAGTSSAGVCTDGGCAGGLR